MTDGWISPVFFLDHPISEKVALDGLGQQPRFENDCPNGCQQQYDEHRDDDSLPQLHWRMVSSFDMQWERVFATGCLSEAQISVQCLIHVSQRG
ncbi:hypothetical protein [Ralstonia pseudosolanacearum]|uniref:hypothetical protein n=1 Tax=Ralstonia pseudosolanacearum TaxID=1310165 RepID=UPI001FFA65FA|nr:hypothetical protein [Ralstonia pseudosolanacearum]